MDCSLLVDDDVCRCRHSYVKQVANMYGNTKSTIFNGSNCFTITCYVTDVVCVYPHTDHSCKSKIYSSQTISIVTCIFKTCNTLNSIVWINVWYITQSCICRVTYNHLVAITTCLFKCILVCFQQLSSQLVCCLYVAYTLPLYPCIFRASHGRYESPIEITLSVCLSVKLSVRPHFIVTQ